MWMMLIIVCILCAHFQVTVSYASSRLVDISSNNNAYENGLVFGTNQARADIA
jgi:hypothetical protein